MLILTRKSGESVMIGADIQVFVLETKGKQVRLAFEAPKAKYPVHRTEIYNRIQTDRPADLARAKLA